jgi:hypothetical protein
LQRTAEQPVEITQLAHAQPNVSPGPGDIGAGRQIAIDVRALPVGTPNQCVHNIISLSTLQCYIELQRRAVEISMCLDRPSG